MNETSQWQKLTGSPKQNGTGLKLINSLVFYQMEFHKKKNNMHGIIPLCTRINFVCHACD